VAVALVVAAGRGERLGSGGPKALVVVAGRPMVEWSLAALRAVPDVERVVVALPPGVEAPAGTVGVTGGRERSHSVRAALAAAGEADVVVVHDAARPLLEPALARACLDALAEKRADAAIAAAPVSDTVKEAGPDHRVVRTLDRSRLWAVQTPQVFRRAALEAALAAGEDELAAATDDASLVEAAGGTVVVVPAPRWNLKVTTPEDLHVAEVLLRERAAGVA
jgi:2-C-methyl-D-erythritol 4-phosphate cytidylyltransferase